LPKKEFTRSSPENQESQSEFSKKSPQQLSFICRKSAIIRALRPQDNGFVTRTAKNRRLCSQVVSFLIKLSLLHGCHLGGSKVNAMENADPSKGKAKKSQTQMQTLFMGNRKTSKLQI